jgi:hypothetical protein
VLAVVTGVIGTYPVGGVAWDYGQYALGLEQLGFDVYYLEDSGLYTYDAERNEYGGDCSYGVRFLEESLAELSPRLAQRWHFRHLDGRTFGISSAELQEVIASSDLFLNVSGLCQLRDEYLPARHKTFIDTDPGWNHFHWFPKWDTDLAPPGCSSYRAHDHFFTYALGLGSPDCRLPDLGIDWHPTRPPVVLDCWGSDGPGNTWTSVLTWDNYGRPIERDGVLYGSKEPEFRRIETLPARVPARLEVAVGGTGAPVDRWRKLGWSVVDSVSISRTAGDYRRYVASSRGEFSVAKNVYVATRSGWFSCRTACYLAAGRPAVVQDTGFSSTVPVGDGLVAFSTLDDAIAGIERIESDVSRHRAAARRLAEEWFDSQLVLIELLEVVGV